MGGLSIGIGVGVSYSYPTSTLNGAYETPSESDVTDGVLTENGNVLMAENDKYIRTENNTDATAEVNYVKSKSYWNF